MGTLTKTQKNLYRAITELAYAIAKHDKHFPPEKERLFCNIIEKHLDEGVEIVESYFHTLQYSINPDFEATYQHAIKLIRENLDALNRLLIRKFLYVLEQVAEHLSIDEEDREVIDRFEQDLLDLHAYKKSEPKLGISSQKANLYSAVGQLAYVIAKADHLLDDDEREAFRQVAKKHLGEFDWLAQDRFNVIDDLMIFDLENAYDHTLYLIRKNINALDDQMVDTFLTVMTEVAEVAGISEEEQAVIDRFKADLNKIYQHNG